MRILSIDGATPAQLADAQRMITAGDAFGFRELLADVDAEPYGTPADLAYLAERESVHRAA